MRFSNSVVAALSFLLGLAAFAGDARAITIDTVPVGNPGNAADPATGSLYGAVGYAYNIGTNDVTNAQYAEFLNAKAASDPLVLYDPRMASTGGGKPSGGITRSGVSGSFVYTTMPNMENKPVNFVNLYDTLRFANWLNNGQGNSSTETGAYTLSGGTPVPSNATSITRNAGATWFLPSEDEWYKAAYYDPRTAAQGGPPADSHYWLFATRSNSAPVQATANSVGDISNPGANVANLGRADWNNSGLGNVTTVGSAGPLSTSFYGTNDQGGNVYQWDLHSLENGHVGGQRGVSCSWDLNSTLGLFGAATNSRGDQIFAFAFPPPDAAAKDAILGFRIASTIPEPSSLVLAAIGFFSLAAWGWRRKRALTD